MTAKRHAFSIVFLTVGLTLACDDGPLEPVSQQLAPEHALLSAHDEVHVLARSRPLPEEVSAARTIGPLGGTLELPEAGLSIVVPAGAVWRPTRITVVAPAGDLVGYHFYPEGTSFAVPLVAVQDLSGTNAGLLEGGLLAAHFDGSLDPAVDALEILPLGLVQGLGIFNISHFSGYVVATN